MSEKRSERMQGLYERWSERVKNPPESDFLVHLHGAALGKYASLPLGERIARSTADAIVAQPVYIDPTDRIIGRNYFQRVTKPEAQDEEFDAFTEPRSLANEKIYEGYDELFANQLVTRGTPGHVAWNWNFILKHGTEGMRERCLRGLARKSDDAVAVEFYNGVLIMLDSLDAWNERHVQELERLGMSEQAEICRRVPKYPARSFYEAVQSYFMQHLVVVREEPHGGNSPGRLDYYLWPYLEADLARGDITEEEAQELVEELFLRIDERIHSGDGWGETVVVGGSHPNGTSAVNPLTYIMIRAFMKYDITHPYFYVRIPKNPPAQLLDLCAHYVMCGGNRAQLVNDASVMAALVKNGVSEEDAADYFCGGCMEVGIQGRTGDFLYCGYHNIAKLLELCMTGGYSLSDHKMLTYFRSKPLAECSTYEEFYESYIKKAEEVFTYNFRFMDFFSEYSEKRRPEYLMCSMIDDCMTKGRNMHAGGARYYDYGASFISIANVADSLTAIKRAVFDDKICSAAELVEALDKNFEGYEELRRTLTSLPKYGQENAEADGIARRLATDLSRIYSSYVNRHGGSGKPVILTFIYAPEAGAKLGASADGRLAGRPIAHGVTPQGASMTKGITAAMNSCACLPFELFSGGASTMWDLDSSFANEEIVRALFTAFFDMGGQFFQGNVTDVEALVKAQSSPEDYYNLIVRVGGYSARFVRLSPSLQNEIIGRLRHGK